VESDKNSENSGDHTIGGANSQVIYQKNLIKIPLDKSTGVGTRTNQVYFVRLPRKFRRSSKKARGANRAGGLADSFRHFHWR
jgi:hypothetical protein